MSRFHDPEAFHSRGRLVLTPIRFERVGRGNYLVSNMVGDFLSLSEDEFDRLINLRIAPGDGLYERAFASLLVTGENQAATSQILAMRLRSRMSFLEQGTGLHLFVVTLRCEHSCPYCQVSRQSADRSKYDMDEQTAQRALAIALQSPAPRIKIEFQGGEPLLNFPLIKKIVERGKMEAERVGKEVEFVIATNLALLDEAVVAFCKTHGILVSTSFDGPRDLHNKNRPRPGGDSYELAVAGIRTLQKELGRDRVGALMTTTESSLGRVREIIDEYLALGLDGIFLRPLSPYGFAVKTKQVSRYDASRWLEFYREGLRYILDLNHSGIRFREFYTSIIMQRMLTDRPLGYVDLRSPAGIGLGALVYNYDGRVFASDEGRMLAEMGDRTFELGHVTSGTYQSLILSEKLVEAVANSLTQCAPECRNCVFESHCGADPVYHHATQGDSLGIKPISGFCARQKGVMGFLLERMENSPKDATILREWGLM